MHHLTRLLPFLAAGFLIAPPAAAVSFDWVTVERPGNACDPASQSCMGAVDDYYRISRFEVTNAQYAEFLNAKAASDPRGLFNTGMTAIARTGSAGSYSYSAVAGQEQLPVTRVSFFDALRFVNWLSNGQGGGDTETGSYTLLGGTATPSNELVGRNPGATIFLTSSDEWHKAAFYDAAAGAWRGYPTGSDDVPICSAPTTAPESVNCGRVVNAVTPVGSYPGTPSASGTYDQAGNAAEWSEEIIILEQRAIHGGNYITAAERLGAVFLDYDDPGFESAFLGFRVAAVAADPAGEGCGDGACDGSETALNCPADCPAVCGDGLCTGDEDVLSCIEDCPDVCGDGVCTGAEGTTDCPDDCGVDCGDGVCNGDEGTANCPDDCGTDCGDGVCNGGEASNTCVPDCGVVCGDGYCANAESPATCPADCGPLCGDDLCEAGEDQNSCPADCAPQCIPEGQGAGCNASTPCCTGVGNCTGGWWWWNVCAPAPAVCGDGVIEDDEQCEAGAPLGATCASLGFAGGDLGCHATSCTYDTSGCDAPACLGHRDRCSSDSQCCSDDCRWGRCRGN